MRIRNIGMKEEIERLLFEKHMLCLKRKIRGFYA